MPLDPGVYDAVASAARSEGIPVVGHAPGRPGGVAAAVREGQRTIEHAESIMQVETVEQDPDTADIPRIVARLRGSGVCITPTLVTFVHVIRMTEQYPTLHDLLARPEMRFVRAELRGSWAPSQNEYVTRWHGHAPELPRGTGEVSSAVCLDAPPDRSARCIGCSDSRRNGCGRRSRHSGVLIARGTSLARRCSELSHASLRAATVNAATCIGRAGEFGVVRPGARADLLLLDRDPLVDITAAAHPRGVVLRGRWLPTTRCTNQSSDDTYRSTHRD